MSGDGQRPEMHIVGVTDRFDVSDYARRPTRACMPVCAGALEFGNCPRCLKLLVRVARCADGGMFVDSSC